MGNKTTEPAIDTSGMYSEDESFLGMFRQYGTKDRHRKVFKMKANHLVNGISSQVHRLEKLGFLWIAYSNNTLYLTKKGMELTKDVKRI